MSVHYFAKEECECASCLAFKLEPLYPRAPDVMEENVRLLNRALVAEDELSKVRAELLEAKAAPKPLDWKSFDATRALVDENERLRSELEHANKRVSEHVERAEKAEAEVERERMRLAACGAVALANTRGSAAEARQMHDDYRSASCDDVASAVDREMAARERAEKAEAACTQMRAECEGLRAALAAETDLTGWLSPEKVKQVRELVAKATTDAPFFPSCCDVPSRGHRGGCGGRFRDAALAILDGAP